MPFKNPKPNYTVWQSMKRRCDNPALGCFNDYGGRGIKVCDEWLHSYDTFVRDMGDKPNGYSLDRIDNNGDYTPQNCRWASRRDQQRNQRTTRYVTIDGRRYRAVDLSDISGMKTDTIVSRAELGMSYADVISAKSRRGSGDGIRKAHTQHMANFYAKTQCKNGHEINDTNTYFNKYGWRSCRVCRSGDKRNHRATAPVPVLAVA